MTRVLVFGVFDVLHPGHRYFLSEAKKHGDILIAAVARDADVQRNKGRTPIQNENTRIEALLEENLTNEAYPGDSERGSYSIINKTKPDIICLGHDQDKLREDLCPWIRVHSPGIKVVVMKPFFRGKYSSSRLNADLHANRK